MLYDDAIFIIDNFPNSENVSDTQLNHIKTILCDYIKIFDYWFPLCDEQLTEAQIECTNLRKQNEDTAAQLAEAKRLLQLAMDELEPIGQCGGYSYRPCDGCPYHSDDSMCNPHWNHYEEVMKILKE